MRHKGQRQEHLGLHNHRDGRYPGGTLERGKDNKGAGDGIGPAGVLAGTLRIEPAVENGTVALSIPFPSFAARRAPGAPPQYGSGHLSIHRICQSSYRYHSVVLMFVGACFVGLCICCVNDKIMLTSKNIYNITTIKQANQRVMRQRRSMVDRRPPPNRNMPGGSLTRRGRRRNLSSTGRLVQPGL